MADGLSISSLSVRAKLWTAYGLLILIAIIITTLALQGFFKSRLALDDLRSENLPEIANALELAQQSASLAAFAPLLGSVRIKSQLEAENARLEEMLGDFAVILETTLGAGDAAPPSALDLSITARAATLTTTLRDLVDVTNQSLSIRGDVLELDHALRNRQGVYESLQAIGAANGATSDFHRLTELAFRSQTTESLSALDALLRDYERTTARIGGALALLPEDLQQTVATFIALQRQSFDLRVARLELQSRSAFLISTANAVSNELALLVQDRVANVTRDVALRGEESAQALASASRTILLLTSIGGAAVAVVVFVVLKDLGGNLALVAHGMSRLSRGDLSVEMPGSDRHDEIGSLSRAFKIFRDYSVQNARLTEEIRQNSKMLEAIFTNMTDGLSVFDDTNRLVTWNPQFLEMHGLKASDIAVGQPFNAVIAQIEHAGFQAVTSDGNLVRPEEQVARRAAESLRYEHRLDDTKVIELRSQPLPGGGFVTTYADLTENRAMEKQLRSAQRMDAIGQMTGGVAHDFNNLLSIITGNLQLLHQDMSEDVQNANRVLRALDASERGASLTQRLLAFTSQQALKPEIVYVGQIAEGLRDLFEVEAEEVFRIKLSLEPGLKPAFVDAGQLETALINLLYNARDAMGCGGFVVIEIRTALHNATERLEFTVSDNGAGMDAETLSRVYEPFFTTKPSGYGTGLGLSMVYGFVKQSGGDIRIDSQMGQGTQVHFSLPVAAADMGRLDAPARGSDGGQGEHILLVEDDPGVRATALDLLQRLGYSVLAKSSLTEAQDALQEMRFDLLFTDVMLDNDTTGLDVARIARSVDPGIRVLFTSGFGRDEVMKKVSLWPDAQLLSKPYRQDDLAAALRTQLREKAA